MALSTHDTHLLQKCFAGKPVKKAYMFQRDHEDLLHEKVDVVTSDGISKYILPYIEKLRS